LLDVFAIVESTVSFVTSGCLSARMEQIGFQWTDFIKFYIRGFFEKSAEKIKVRIKSDKCNL